jgi:hypothetical protein
MVAAPPRTPYLLLMRGNRRLPRILFHALFVLCALTLIVALAATGAGITAILSVIIAIPLFFLPPVPTAARVPVSVRRFPRRASPRSPPRF